MKNNTICLDNIKNEIISKREELNNLVQKSINKDEILKFSQELDVLINDYIKNKYETQNKQ